MGIFSDINKHSQTGGGIYYQKGNYRVRIDKIIFKNGFRGQSYIIEAEVLASDNPELVEGDKVSHVIKLDKAPAKGNIASFLRTIAATMQAKESGEVVDPETIDVDESDVEASYSEDQPFAGLELEVYAYPTTTQAGKPFTVIQYKVPSELSEAA